MILTIEYSRKEKSKHVLKNRSQLDY